MSGRSSDGFLAERVEALAIMHLTRRPDLVVRRRSWQDPQAEGLLVEIRERGRPPSRKVFGVSLDGAKAPVTIEGASTRLKLGLGRFFSNYEGPTIPYILFYFTMLDDQGYATWAAEPVVESGRHKLKYHRSRADCVRLDREALDRLVAAVDAYYEALYSEAIRAS
jgi:hypothetical protein